MGGLDASQLHLRKTHSDTIATIKVLP